ncbi:methyltransferase [uncultured Parasphingorhabdus sp.]|uniref:class I SAM-dependent methyltransferase n=1 Tax=uncultured Parasphingorhabdus sp. TaxID=2709694 RepID=UPI002AA7F898|nr:methyltransferase [uncultured Parasphingorhabdus sp.]
MKNLLMASAALAMLGAAAPAVANDHGKDSAAMTDASLQAVLDHERRADDKARDIYRHPAETLAFFGVTADQTVAEYAPGGGWYTKILAPYLADKGQYIGINYDPAPLPFPEDRKAEMAKWGAEFPVKVAEMTGIPADKFKGLTTGEISDELAGSVDFVFIPRMMHNLMRWNVADSEIKALRRLLKENGTIGIVQHRAKDDAPFSYANGSRGYLRTDTVVNFMEAHGFELVKQSEVNANPEDSADYPKGVWTLPPRFAEGDADKAKYEAIGESDRMTLLFKKLP